MKTQITFECRQVTKDMVRCALKQGVISFGGDPCIKEGGGTVFWVGRPEDKCSDWFYFGGMAAASVKPDEYISCVGFETAVDEIFICIQEMMEEDPMGYLHCARAIESSVSRYREVVCDDLDSSDHFWRVDVREYDADGSSSKRIAYIDDFTGRVIYVDPCAKDDPSVKEVIDAKVKEIEQSSVQIIIGRNGLPSLAVRTERYAIYAEVDRSPYGKGITTRHFVNDK